jgi:gas vesicle protein
MTGKRREYFLIGLFAGGALGVIGGLLLAPDAGSRTRKRLLGEAMRVADAAKAIAERAETAVESMGTRMDHYLGKDEEVAWRKVRQVREGVQQYSRTVMSS